MIGRAMSYESDAPESCEDCKYMNESDGFWPDECGIEGRVIHSSVWEQEPARPVWCPLYSEEDRC